MHRKTIIAPILCTAVLSWKYVVYTINLTEFNLSPPYISLHKKQCLILSASILVAVLYICIQMFLIFVEWMLHIIAHNVTIFNYHLKYTINFFKQKVFSQTKFDFCRLSPLAHGDQIMVLITHFWNKFLYQKSTKGPFVLLCPHWQKYSVAHRMC